MKILLVGVSALILLVAVAFFAFNSPVPSNGEAGKLTGNVAEKDFNTFKETGNDLCLKNGKPVIRLYSTTWCPHCRWIKETFDRVAREYVEKGKIVAYHWELDTGDNTLTEGKEGKVPDSEMQIFRKFDPSGGVPAFVFGCKYYRLGNGYERTENGLALEKEEFMNLIDYIIEKQ